MTEPRSLLVDEILFACTICGAWFIKSTVVQVSCTVAHSPGSCCHYDQEPVGDRAIVLTPRTMVSCPTLSVDGSSV